MIFLPAGVYRRAGFGERGRGAPVYRGLERGLQELPGGGARGGAGVQRGAALPLLRVRAPRQGRQQDRQDGGERPRHLQRALEPSRGVQGLRYGTR